MNYLAHIYFSGTNPQQQLGGFIADGVKGRQHESFPKDIREGILRHRRIDHLTDTHPSVLKLKRKLSPTLGRYSGIILDIFMDHILASDFQKITGRSFRLFTLRFYLTALLHYPSLPKRFKRFIFHFVLTNRLGRYAHKEGIRESLKIMIHYRELNIDADTAIHVLEEYETEIRTVFYEVMETIETI